MTKKHFELIADVLNKHLENAIENDAYGAIIGMAETLANEFESVNPRFNKARFLKRVKEY